MREHRDWRLGILDCERHGGQRSPEGRGYLPPRQAAWVFLLHDLAWNWRTYSVLENLVHRLRGTIVDSRASIESTRDLGTGCSGWARYNAADQWVHFPFPNVDTFRQLDRLLTVWSYRPGTDRREPPEELHAAVQKWALASWIAEDASDDRYERYSAVGRAEDAEDSGEWYVECALTLESPSSAGDGGGRTTFADYRESLFSGHSVLTDAANRSRD